MTTRIDDAPSFTQLIRTLSRERLLRLAARAHQFELGEEVALIAREFRRRRAEVAPALAQAA